MANTFKFGAKQWATKEGSVLAYNDENNNFKPLPFDFTRSSSATRVNKDGLIEVVGSNEPRVDYLNNADGHLLLEPSRTNQVDNSIDFFAGSWSGTRIAEGSTIVSPDGSNNAHKLVPSTDNNTHYRVYTYSPASAGSYTASAFFKKGEYEVGVIRIDADSAANRIGVAINLSDGTFISQNTTGTPTGTSYKIDSYGNGWYRLSVTITHTSGDVRINVSTASDSWGWSNGLPLFIGDDSSGAYSWGAMIEQGSYATSYIPTSGSSVTRASEGTNTTAENANLGSKDIFGSNGYSMLIDLSGEPDGKYSDDNTVILQLYQGDTAGLNAVWDIRKYYSVSEGRVRIYSNLDGSTIFYANSENKKYCVVINGTNIKVFSDGAIEATNNVTTSHNTVGSFRLYSGTVERASTQFKNIQIFDEVLSDEQAASLTS